MQPLRCPNCGNPNVEALQDSNKYHCPSCGSNSILKPETHLLVLLSVGVSCPNCGRANDASAKYCGDCGSPLVFPCPFCWRVHQPAERYCPSCGELMRGIPKTSPEDVISTVERNFQRWSGKAPLHPRISPSIGAARKDLKSLFEAGETAMWSFIPPRNEQSRRNIYGYLLFVSDNGKLLRDGLLVATSSRFLYYSPAIPQKKRWFRSQPGSPAFHIEYPYSEIIGLRFDLNLPVSRETLNVIVSQYPVSYSPHVSVVARASTGPGWEMSLKGGRFLRFRSLPNGGISMKQLRFWESVFRTTLGVARSDLDYIPYPTPR